jgi:hypothetical protein
MGFVQNYGSTLGAVVTRIPGAQNLTSLARSAYWVRSKFKPNGTTVLFLVYVQYSVQYSPSN